METFKLKDQARSDSVKTFQLLTSQTFSSGNRLKSLKNLKNCKLMKVFVLFSTKKARNLFGRDDNLQLETQALSVICERP